MKQVGFRENLPQKTGSRESERLLQNTGENIEICTQVKLEFNVMKKIKNTLPVSNLQILYHPLTIPRQVLTEGLSKKS